MSLRHGARGVKRRTTRASDALVLGEVVWVDGFQEVLELVDDFLRLFLRLGCRHLADLVEQLVGGEQGRPEPHRQGDRVGFLGIGSGLNCMMLGLEW